MKRTLRHIFYVCIFSFIAPIAHAAPAESLPNILLILADDLGWGDFGCYPKGSDWGEEARTATPHIDRFAKRGILCTDAYATGMVCCRTSAAKQAPHRTSDFFGVWAISRGTGLSARGLGNFDSRIMYQLPATPCQVAD